MCMRALNRNWADAEREREMCMRALNRNWADAERERARERDVYVRAEQKLSRRRERERERCVCVLNRNWVDAEREREMCMRALNRNWADAEREGYVCVCWESKTSSGITGDSRRLNKGAFLKGKKSLKGSALLLSWQHCASPFLQLWIGPRVKQKIRAALLAR